MFKGFKAVVLCRVGVACKDNSKVVRCSNAGAGEAGCDRLVCVCGG